jgi:hypothetical protein
MYNHYKYHFPKKEPSSRKVAGAKPSMGLGPQPYPVELLNKEKMKPGGVLPHSLLVPKPK